MRFLSIIGWITSALLIGVLVGMKLGEANTRYEISKNLATYYGRNAYDCVKRVKVHPPVAQQ
jgi:hypothetical protein